MKKTLSICLMLMCQLALMGQARIGANPDFNPNNPEDPNASNTKYILKQKVYPEHAGDIWNDTEIILAEGESVWIEAYNNSGYRFVSWNQGDTVVSNSQGLYYTMPAKNVTLTAVFKYDPESPADPEPMPLSHTLTLEPQPRQGGSFNMSEERVPEGEGVWLYAYPNNHYQFKGWKMGDSILSDSQELYYAMGNADTHIVGVFEYNPASPGNPGSNLWNPATGEIVVDDFTPGNLSNAIYNTLDKNGSSRDEVSMITVAGKMEEWDFSVANEFSNCTLLDLSRSYGYTRIPDWAFDWNGNLQHIVLPAEVEHIGYRAFNNCNNLTEITCYAITPPTVEYSAFDGVAEGAVLHVLAAAIPLYAEAEGWKDYFTIVPLTEEVRTLEINLPAGSEDGRYKNMTLELVNVDNGRKQKYVISDRVSYTFSGLLKESVFNVYVRNSLGYIIGQIDNVEIEDEDVSVTFESLLQPQDVALSVLTAEGEDVTNQVQATWFETASNTYLSRGNMIKGVTEGTQLTLRVALPQALGMAYVAPEDLAYTVRNSNNSVVVTLNALPEVTISGIVKDVTTGGAIAKAVVSVSQTLNGKYSKAFTTKTDNKGAYSLTVYNAPSTLTYSSAEYITQTASFDDFTASTELGTISLKAITGATITTSFTYRTSVEEGATPDIQDWYSDYANVAYSIYNKTQQKPINDFSVQHPSIVLLEEVAEGDELVLTATSKKGAFVPVEATAVIDASNRAEAIFDIVALGGIKASFTSTDNSAVVGILYNAGGQLMKKYNYSSATININDLQDGKYTLVTMGSSTLFNSIYNLSQLESTGLKEGTDYVKNTVTVESGLIASISNDLIPTLDESKLYYTGDNTMFSVNKTSVTAGNYLTLKGKIDFKSVYASKVSNVSMVIDLPESAEFVENSVMVGTGIASYTLDGNRLTIPLERYTDQVRFCIIPTTGGDYAPNAFAQFTIEDKEVLQPIGSAHYTIKDLSISVPSTVAKTTIPVSGTALGNSTIQIYDNGVLIGETTSLANGVWSTTCELDEPYNLSNHKIYAKVINKQGLELLSETKDLLYDMNAIQVYKVTMFHWNPEMRKTYESVFDFMNPSSKPNKWTVYYPDKKFTYTVEFTNNSPEVVYNVVLYVHAADGQIVPLYPTYNESKDLWIAEIDMGNRSDSYYPVNVSVDFDCISEKVIDRNYFSSLENEIDSARFELEQIEENIQYFESEIVRIETKYEASVPIIDKCINQLQSENDIDKDILYLKELYELISWEFCDSLFFVDPIVDDSQDFIDSLMEDVEEILSDNVEDFAILDLEFLNIMNAANKLIAQIDKETLIEDSSIYNYDERTFIVETAIGNYDYAEIPISELDRSTWEDEYITTIKMTDGSALLFYYDNINISIVDEEIGKAWTFSLQDNLVRAHQRGITSEDVVQKLHEAFNALNSARALITNMINDWTSAVKDDISKLTSLKDEIESKWMNELAESAATQRKIERIERQLQEIGKQVDNGTSANYMGEAVDFNHKIEQLKTKRQTLLRKAELHNKYISQYEAKINGFKAKLAIKTALLGEIMDYWEIVTGIAQLIDIIQYGIRDMAAWNSMIGYILPCDAEETAAINLKNRAEEYRGKWGRGYLGAGALSFASTGLSGYCAFNKAAKFVMKTIGGLVSSFIKETAVAVFEDTKNGSHSSFNEIQQRRNALNCMKNCGDEGMPPCPEPPSGGDGNGPNGGNSGGNNGGGHISGQPGDEVQIDPSGYIYEGVSSNRVEGVMASCYYKETVEDMYGDLHENVVFWDAEQYAQENPLFTDENGMYRWDVPQGLWQVKFEKEGYETTYSDWLPVPPPQLEVNIGIKQSTQPEVKTARAYEDGIEVEFSKYMQPDLLNTEYIFVTKNGEIATGSVKLLNEEQSYEGKVETYASKVRFVPETSFLTTDEVVLTVSRKVKSYAGIQMEADYIQEFDIEKEVKRLVADSIIQVPYTGTKQIVISALPYDAAIGKKLIVKSSSSMIATINADTLTMDENGQATVRLRGELPGTSVMTFELADADVSGMSTVQVAISDIQITANPTASRVSGTAVYRNTEVTLNCDTKEAVIYYTLDGSCPCDEDTRLVYTGPIAITGDMTLKVMAVAEGMFESDVVEYNYTLKKTTLGLSLNEGWNWVSHNVENAIAVTELQQNAARIVSQTEELVNDPVYGWVGGIDSIRPTEGYKMEVMKNTNHTLTGYEYNAITPIPVFKGWNWISYPVSQVMSVNEALANVAPSVGDYIVGQDGFALYTEDKWTGTLLTLKPGSGYMYHAQQEGEISYNTAIVSKAKALYGRGLVNKTPWTADKYKYPRVMCLIADLYYAGALTDDYYVGAFCGTECRGVGKYVEGKLMMNIYGEGNEEIAFIAMHCDSEVTFEIIEKLKFEEILLGSMTQAYPLHIGEETSVLNVESSLKVRMEGDMLYLSLNGKSFDRVTLTDVYGDVLMVEENVTADEPLNCAALPDGVYIVTIVQDGVIYYNKILKVCK